MLLAVRLFTWLWWWLLLRFLNCQSPLLTTVFLRITLNQTIRLHYYMLHFQWKTALKKTTLLSRDKATELACDGSKHDSISFEKNFFWYVYVWAMNYDWLWSVNFHAKENYCTTSESIHACKNRKMIRIVHFFSLI